MKSVSFRNFWVRLVLSVGSEGGRRPLWATGRADVISTSIRHPNSQVDSSGPAYVAQRYESRLAPLTEAARSKNSDAGVECAGWATVEGSFVWQGTSGRNRSSPWSPKLKFSIRTTWGDVLPGLARARRLRCFHCGCRFVGSDGRRNRRG